MLEELQTLGIQEGIAGAIKHKNDTVRDLLEPPLPEEPPGHPPLLGEEGGRRQSGTITVHPSEGELVNRSLMSIVLLEGDRKLVKHIPTLYYRVTIFIPAIINSLVATLYYIQSDYFHFISLVAMSGLKLSTSHASYAELFHSSLCIWSTFTQQQIWSHSQTTAQLSRSLGMRLQLKYHT